MINIFKRIRCYLRGWHVSEDYTDVRIVSINTDYLRAYKTCKLCGTIFEVEIIRMPDGKYLISRS